jgi:translation initiation factor 5B
MDTTSRTLSVMAIRQPIVSVLGHVDHGKTTLLDAVRGSTVAAREAGGITQHIGATEVPIKVVYDICGDLMGGKTFVAPGLLFIDTPGHQSFIAMRNRGGSLADIAVLVIDINEGPKPQTIESIRILKQYKTPFVIVLNKIDLTPSWRKVHDLSFAAALAEQSPAVRDAIDQRIYNIAGKLYEHGFSADRYDRISDFTKNVALIPASAKSNVGMADLLMMLVGLAQRFLEEQLTKEDGPGEGTILEVKEERGLGTTVDVILFKGILRVGDMVALGTRGPPKVTKVKAILKPRPLDEIRDPREKFDLMSEVTAASGIKVVCQDSTGVVAGAPIRVLGDDPARVIEEVAEESSVSIETSEDGIIIKADAIGSLEALAFEAKAAGILIKRAEVGDVTRRDVVDAATISDPKRRVLLGFNVSVIPEAKEELDARHLDFISSNIIYRLLDDYKEWLQKKTKEMETNSRSELCYPGKVLLLPDCVFRASKPAIVGVRVLAGRVRAGQRLIRDDDLEVGRIKSIRSGEETVAEALQGKEVALAIEGPTVGRQINVGDALYVDIPEGDARALRTMPLNQDERDVLDRLIEIKAKGKKFWGK